MPDRRPGNEVDEERLASRPEPAGPPPRALRSRKTWAFGVLALVAVAAMLGYAASLGTHQLSGEPVNIGPAVDQDQGLGPDQPGDVLGIGRAIHVAEGAQSGGDGSAGAPFGTIQAALDIAQPGDAIRVGPGSYPGLVHTVRAGTQDKPIWLVGDNARIVAPPGSFPPRHRLGRRG